MDKEALIRKVVSIIDDHRNKVTYSTTMEPSQVASRAKKAFSDASDDVKRYLRQHLKNQ